MKCHLLSSKIKQIILLDLSKYFTFFKQNTFRNLHELQTLEMCVTLTEEEGIGSKVAKHSEDVYLHHIDVAKRYKESSCSFCPITNHCFATHVICYHTINTIALDIIYYHTLDTY
jgi:hypothetical protein